MNETIICVIGGFLILFGFMIGPDEERRCNASPIDCGNVWCCIKYYGSPVIMVVGGIVMVYGLVI